MSEFQDSCDADDLWRPACSLQVLRLRALMLDTVRRFFADAGYLEVETPLLSRDIVVDAHLEPFAVVQTGDKSHQRYLQTSPEAGMKRLLAAGSGSIFQITRSFRRGERGRRHNSEFTIVEWYGVGTTYQDQMQLTERLIHTVAAAVSAAEECEHQHPTQPEQPEAAAEISQVRDGAALLSRTFGRISYEVAFRNVVEAEVLDASVAELQALVAARIKGMPDDEIPADRDDLLNLLLAECVEPALGAEHPEFLHDYPVSQAALAEQNPEDARTACRFELYAKGIELCNGYQELTDADELRRRESLQNQSRSIRAAEHLPGARQMMNAMKSGLPPCSGVALGFDRLVMCLADVDEIDRVLSFPDERA